MTENNELDEILADDDATVDAAVDQTQDTITEPDAEHAKGPERDESGKFKAKSDEAPEVSDTEAQADVEGKDPDAEGKVPQQALHASRQKEKAANDRADALERNLLQMQGQLEAIQRQVQQPQAKAEPAKSPDFWEDPDNFVASRLTPIEQKMQQQAERMSQRFAVQEFGQDTVETAYAEFGKALRTDPRLKSEYERIRQSDHPYGEIVQWHKQQQTRQLVGDDPQAWLEAELERRLADPAEQAKFLERIQASASGTKSDPVTNLPRSLNRLPGGGNSAIDTDVSDEALFNHATS